MKQQTHTPMMQQFYECKKQAHDALLLFRLGDFYECFEEDAKTLSKALNVTLTQRHEIAMSGIPVHTLETHLLTLMKKNFVVAIAEQVELAGEQKGLLKRKVIRVVSPATYFEMSQQLSENTFFAALFQINSIIALCLIDVSTGECFVQEETSIQSVVDEIYKRSPKELLLTKSLQSNYKEPLEALSEKIKIKLHLQENYQFDYETNYEFLTRKFKINSLDSFGLKGKTAAINASGALMSYLMDVLCQDLSAIDKIQLLKSDHYLALDQSSLINLGILPKKEEKTLSLLELLDNCHTPMGSRLMQSWLIHPLLSITKIQKRHQAVEQISLSHDLFQQLEKLLEPIKDVERFTLRLQSKMICPRDLYALSSSLMHLDQIAALLNENNSELLNTQKLDTHAILALCKKALSSLNESCPIKLNEGGIFKAGIINEVDQLKELQKSAKEYLVNLQDKLRVETGIKSLKVSFNNAFGYFIQVPRAQGEKMPAHFEKKQSLVNNERFICQELKDYEHKILSSQDRIIALEKEHFFTLRDEFFAITDQLKAAAKHIARVDTLKSLAQLALENDYTKPSIDNGHGIKLDQARHPLVEVMDKKDNFISNDTNLTLDTQKLHLITGPNMGGKSTYIRQVALIVILAQMGSFVPAKAAQIGIVDKVFSRIGANDDLSRGQSTFMVEMTETANILHNATSKSLVVLDEIGRGTSTFDGIAIAQAVTEHLHDKKIKTLFATHYFELANLEKTHKGIKNFQASVKETDDGVIFLHKIQSGSANKSYGIHVAKLSGLPKSVLMRSSIILKGLSQSENKKLCPKENQLSFFESPSQENKIAQAIKEMNLDETTPLKALESLIEFKKSLY